MPRPKRDATAEPPFTPPSFEVGVLDPATIRPRLSAKEAASQAYFDGLVRTAPRDKSTAYYLPESEARAFALRLGKALGRTGLRDTFVTGTTITADGRHCAYLRPKSTIRRRSVSS